MFRPPQTIRAKLLLILLGLCAAIAAAFVVYFRNSAARYRELRTSEMAQTVAFESERVARLIAEMDRYAIDLARAGQQYYAEHGASVDGASLQAGDDIVVASLIGFPNAVGGGIWFEPYVIAGMQRLAFYAYRDGSSGEVVPYPREGYATDDYQNQAWFQSITAVLRGQSATGASADNEDNRPTTAWTTTYHGHVGSHALMSTVGAGIFDDSGALVGTTGVDWEIEEMVNRLAAIRPTPGSFLVLAAPLENQVIANTGTDLAVGSSFSELSWAAALPSSNDEVSQGSVRIAGTEYLTFSRRFDNGWLLSVQVPEAELYADLAARIMRFAVALGFALALALAASWLLMSRLVTRPVHRLAAQVAHHGSTGDLDTPIAVTSNDEIGVLAGAFNQMTADLKGSIAQRMAVTAEKERIGTELSVAHDIQAAILPHEFPAFPDRGEFDVYACMYPQREIGGDFYDFLLIDDNTLAVVIADVSGKGVPAALFMMSARTLLHNTLRAGLSPERALTLVNNGLCENNNSAMFVTAFLACLDLTTGLVQYANAGHNPPLVIRRAAGADDSDRVSWLEVKPDFVLGAVPDVAYHPGQIQLASGDALLLYTDGVTEALNADHKLYGEQRLIAAVEASLDQDVAQQCEAIRQDVIAFVAGAEQADDLTMLAVRFVGQVPAELTGNEAAA